MRNRQNHQRLPVHLSRAYSDGLTARQGRIPAAKPGFSRQLVSGLNSLGVAPHDMISILQTIKASGALQADLIMQ
jgi:flagellar basal body P-ring protein FlgI